MAARFLIVGRMVATRGGAAVARVFITGSSDGLGLMAARLLIEQGHEVVLHGRDEGRSRDALAAAPGARGVVSGDLATIAGARTVADEVNKLGRFDAVIHKPAPGMDLRLRRSPVRTRQPRCSSIRATERRTSLSPSLIITPT